MKKLCIVSSAFLFFVAVYAYPLQLPGGFGVPFEESMGITKYYKQILADHAAGTPCLHYQGVLKEDYFHWKTAKQLYDKHIVHNVDYSELPRIPKKIHWIWLGSSVPEAVKELQKTWFKYHPDWEFYLWTEKEIDAFGLVNKWLFDRAKNYGQKSDIARYEILYRLGGLYIDTDFECLRAFDVFHHCCDFYSGLNCGPGFEIFNGLIASRPGHPILKNCIDSLNDQNNFQGWSKDVISIMYQTGPYFFTERIKKHLLMCNDRVILFPTSYFYPWPYFEKEQKTRDQIEKWVRKETFAIHHWHNAWMKNNTGSKIK